MSEITKELTIDERAEELYISLGNPELPDALARLYASEYLFLRGKDQGGVWLFLRQREIDQIKEWLDLRKQFNTSLTIIFLGIGILSFVKLIEAIQEYRVMTQTATKRRLDYLLDPMRVESYTTEQFKVAMAEAASLLSGEITGDEIFHYKEEQ